MKKNKLKYNIYIKSVLILIVALFLLTFIHLLYRNNKVNTSKSDVNESINLSSYDKILSELSMLDENVDKSKNVSFNENIYMLDFYKKASEVYYDKLIEINKIICEKLNDVDAVSDYNYEFDKYIRDLDNDASEINRLYESTILSSLEIYKNKYEKLRDKCYSAVNKYLDILD